MRFRNLDISFFRSLFLFILLPFILLTQGKGMEEKERKKTKENKEEKGIGGKIMKKKKRENEIC